MAKGSWIQAGAVPGELEAAAATSALRGLTGLDYKRSIRAVQARPDEEASPGKIQQLLESLLRKRIRIPDCFCEARPIETDCDWA